MKRSNKRRGSKPAKAQMHRALAGLGAASKTKSDNELILELLREALQDKREGTSLPPSTLAEIEKVTSAFVAGKAKSYRNESKDIEVVSQAGQLTVGENVVAQWQGPPPGGRENPDGSDKGFGTTMKVCPGAFGTAQAERYAANMLLSSLSTGVKVRKSNRRTKDYDVFETSEGDYLNAPDVACYIVDVPTAVRQKALQNMKEASASAELKARSEELKTVLNDIAASLKARMGSK